MKMQWNLRVMMAKNGINSASELKRRLAALGVEISTSQMARIVRDMPEKISLIHLQGLALLFRCYPNDLILVEHDGDHPDTNTVSKPSPTTSPGSERGEDGALARREKAKAVFGQSQQKQESIDPLTGPDVRPFSTVIRGMD